MIDFIKILGCSLINTVTDLFDNEDMLIILIPLGVFLWVLVPFGFLIFLGLSLIAIIKDNMIKENWELIIPYYICSIFSLITSIIYVISSNIAILSGTIPFAILNLGGITACLILCLILCFVKNTLTIFIENYKICKQKYKESN